MKNVHRLARTWQYMLIGSSTGLVLISFLAAFVERSSGKFPEFPWIALILGVISGVLAYGTITSKITTSPEGIESLSFGISSKAAWDKVVKVDINHFGFVNLVLKESIYKSRVVNLLLRPLTYDRTIQLSPYMDDLTTSQLLQDIAKYVPSSEIPQFAVTHKNNIKPYQKVGAIGLYYLGWLFIMVLLALILRKGAEYLQAMGLSNMTLVSYIIGNSLMVSLFFNGLRLLEYNAEILEANERAIARKARTHYLSPFVAILMGFLVSTSIWTVLQARSIILPEDDYGISVLIVFIISATSLRVSERIEKLIFK